MQCIYDFWHIGRLKPDGDGSGYNRQQFGMDAFCVLEDQFWSVTV